MSVQLTLGTHTLAAIKRGGILRIGAAFPGKEIFRAEVATGPRHDIRGGMSTTLQGAADCLEDALAVAVQSGTKAGS